MTVYTQHYEQNVIGRDFVVGDIHGCFSLLDCALKTAEFNPRTDRLFCVGDLVDHGPESYRVLGYLNQPWFHSVRGDHEHEIPNDIREMQERGKDAVHHAYQRNGMGWLLDLSPTEQDEICAAFSHLPILMIVDFSDTEAAGLVHAEVPIGQDWQDFRQSISELQPDAIRSALKGRSRITSQVALPDVAGISRIFCGHSLAYERGIKSIGNSFCLDTGAVLRVLNKRDTNFPRVIPDDFHLTIADISAPAHMLLQKRPAEDSRPFHLIFS